MYYNHETETAGATGQATASVKKYVYLDENNTLHTRLYCTAIGKETGELGSADRAVTSVLKEDVTADMIKYTCARCVSDSTYEELKKIAK